MSNDNDLLKLEADIALCNNALLSNDIKPINYQNIRTVVAGIGEILVRKQRDGLITLFK